LNANHSLGILSNRSSLSMANLIGITKIIPCIISQLHALFVAA